MLFVFTDEEDIKPTPLIQSWVKITQSGKNYLVSFVLYFTIQTLYEIIADSDNELVYMYSDIWFVNPEMFVPSRSFWINEFSGLLNRPSVQKRKSVPALFVRISEISRLSEPGLTNHHCIQLDG